MLAACGVKQVSKRQAREKVPRGCYCRLFACFECWRRRRPLRRRRRGAAHRAESFLVCLQPSASTAAAAVEAATARLRREANSKRAQRSVRTTSRLHVTLLFSYSCFDPLYALLLPMSIQFELRLPVSHSDCCYCCRPDLLFTELLRGRGLSLLSYYLTPFHVLLNDSAGPNSNTRPH